MFVALLKPGPALSIVNDTLFVTHSTLEESKVRFFFQYYSWCSRNIFVFINFYNHIFFCSGQTLYLKWRKSLE